MDLEYSLQDRKFSEKVEHFLVEAWTRPQESKPADQDAFIASFRALATERGYLYRSVPRRFGGSEQPADVMRARLIREAFERARAPMEIEGIGVAMLVPTLLERGQDWQKEMFVPPTLSGEIRWAQGYSEPGAGSDLASLTTRGELVGDDWIINGHKIWTTRAYQCTHMFALVRTEPEAGKHDGISYLLIKLDQPGVTIRRIHQITDESEFCEVFFDDVRTPANWIVGERGKGWDISRTTLKHERNFIGNERSQKLFGSLLRLARKIERNGQPALSDPILRDRILSLEGYVQAQKLSGLYQLTQAGEGETAQLLQLTNKLASSEIGLRIAEIASDIVGDRALALPNDGEGDPASRWLNQILGSLAISIAGGTSNIQRNVIAERGLGLPRSEMS